MPDPIYVAFFAVLGVAVAALIALEVRRRDMVRLFLENQELRQERDQLDSELEEAKRLLGELRALPPKIIEVEQQVVALTNQRDGYRGIIEEIQAERDTWRRMYYSQGTGHDNAQRWMMREIATLTSQVQSLGGKPKISPTLPTVRADFEREHGQQLKEHRSGRADERHAEQTKRETDRAHEIESSQ